MPVGERAEHCPPFLVRLIAEARTALASPLRIYVYGSRARGDQRPLSDYDLAFDTPSDVPSRHRWLRFVTRQRDEVGTLLDVDWLWLPEAPEALLRKIEEEGVMLNEG
jgi:predicted nucleotidyltransferase